MPFDALKSYASRAHVEGYTADDVPSTFSETYDAAFALTRREELSDSADRAFRDANERRAQAIASLGGDAELAREYARGLQPMVRDSVRESLVEGLEGNNPFWRGMTPYRQRAVQQMIDFERRYPEQVQTDQQILDEFKAQAAEFRGQEQYAMDRGGGFPAFLGTAAAIFTDPLVLATLPFGASMGVGRGALATIGRTAAIEGSIATAVEVPIQAAVFNFKREIESPWSFRQSALNVLSAGAGGAVLGGGIAGGIVGTRKALAAYRGAKDAGRVSPTADMDEAERILEDTIGLHDENPMRLADLDDDTAPLFDSVHESAVEDARVQHADGEAVDVANHADVLEPQDGITQALRRAEDPGELVPIDPRALDVDAETFQFKGGSDAEGVTDALKDVTEFDRRLAGVSLIWERADGKQFIADGHQRRALALRALAGGQDPAEVRLNGFVLREADGVTAIDARRMAAVKNMAEGTGSALDAAKILRDVGKAGEALLPPLPPRSALVRQARGLAELSEDNFLKVVNDVIDTRFGAIIGATTADGKLQSAMIDVLRRTKPANEIQARSIIEQVRTAGTETRVTSDLFGDTAITESLYLERAQVLDAALREARKDKAVFGRLLADEGRITETGANRLDTQANEARLQEAASATTQISRLANTKGPISEALSEAARQLKAGKKPDEAAETFLDAARRALSDGGERGGKARRARSPRKKPDTVKPDDQDAASAPESALERRTGPVRQSVEEQGNILADAQPRKIVADTVDPGRGTPDASKTGTIPDTEYEAVMSQAQDLLENHGALARVGREVNGQLETRSLGDQLDQLDTLEDTLERIRVCSLPGRGA